MDGLDYWVVGSTILLMVGGLAALLLVLLAIRRAMTIFGLGYIGRHKNKTLARLSLLSIGLGIIFGLLLLISGGPNGQHTAAAYDGYIEATLCVGLIITGVVLTFFIRVPRPKKVEKLNTKIVQHANVAWPWRHKLVIVIASIAIVCTGIFTYNILSK